MAVYDRVIRGGTVFDGTRVPRYRADIAVKDGVIADIGRYPTETLCKIVRKHEMISPEEAHWRLSALPAMFAG